MESTVEKLTPRRQSTVSGTGMDRRIERRYPKWLKPAAIAGAIVLGLGLLFVFFTPAARSLKVANDRVVVSDVVAGKFDDFIPVRSRVTPLKTVFLDAVEGGQVEAIHVEDGAAVERGQLLVELSNTSLQLDVISREVQVVEQLNDMRSLELAQEQNRLSHKRELVEVEYQITRLGRLIARQKALVEKGYVPRADFEDIKDEYDYNVARGEILLESQATDARLQEAQLIQLRAASKRMESNLDFARRNLESLLFSAPVSGQLTAFDLEVGQSLSPGERIGQIDTSDDFKLTANIDEFYLDRVDIGQQAQYETGGRAYGLRVAKIYPQVRNGQFKVDMVFAGEAPENIRRGQTAQTRLQLSDPSDAVLIPNGAFYQDTGGNWIFVVSSDGTRAVRRNVRLGRRNLKTIEVLDGLEPGDRVITSPYTSFLDMERLELTF